MISSWASLLVTINNKPLLFKGAIHPLVQGATTFFQPFWILVSHIYACLPWEHRSGLHPQLSIIMQARLVCLSSALLLCKILIHAYACTCTSEKHCWPWLLWTLPFSSCTVITAMNLLCFWAFLLFLSWLSIALFYEPSENFMQTHKFRGCGWCGSLNLTHLCFSFAGGKEHTSIFHRFKKGRIPTESLSLYLYLLTHTLKKVTRYMRCGFNPE